jgi:hypothetical protein
MVMLDLRSEGPRVLQAGTAGTIAPALGSTRVRVK